MAKTLIELIEQSRSKGVSVWVGVSDTTHLKRIYGDEADRAEGILNSINSKNIFMRPEEK